MTRTSRAAALGLAALAMAAAPASAADHAGAVSKDATEFKYTTGTHTGAVYTSDVSSQVPACTSVIFACETALVEVKDAGKLVFKITGTSAVPDATVPFDVDLHVFRSDKDGTQGELLGEGTSPQAAESVTVAASRGTRGFYLVVQDWYFGAGSVAGSVKLTPNPVPAPAP